MACPICGVFYLEDKMNDKVKCSCCNGEMDKSFIGEHYNWIDCINNLKEELSRQRQENAVIKKDVEMAAGELLVSIPEPGTDMFRLLVANNYIHVKLQLLEAELEKYKTAMSDVIERTTK